MLSTIILITKREIYICCGSKTSQTLKQLQTKTGQSQQINIGINLITKNKQDGYKQNFMDVLQRITFTLIL